MKEGKSAQEALDLLLSQDPEKDVRQVAFVDAKGRVAAWTGSKCIAAAGHQTGTGYSVQANLMDKPTVWPAMARAFEARRAISPTGCSRPSTPPRPKAGTSAAARARPCWSSAASPRASPGKAAWSTCAWTTIRSPWPSCGGS